MVSLTSCPVVTSIFLSFFFPLFPTSVLHPSIQGAGGSYCTETTKEDEAAKSTEPTAAVSRFDTSNGAGSMVVAEAAGGAHGFLLGDTFFFTVADFIKYYGSFSTEIAAITNFQKYFGEKRDNEIRNFGRSKVRLDASIRTFFSIVPLLDPSKHQYEVLQLPVLLRFVERMAEQPEDLAHINDVAIDTLSNFRGQEETILLRLRKEPKALKSELLGITGTRGEAYLNATRMQKDEVDADPEASAKYAAIRRCVGKFLSKPPKSKERQAGEEYGLASPTELGDVLALSKPAKNVASVCISILTGVGVMKRVKFAHLPAEPDDLKKRINDLASLMNLEEYDLEDTVTTAYVLWQDVISPALSIHPKAWDVAASLAVALADVANDSIRDAFIAEAAMPTLAVDAPPSGIVEDAAVASAAEPNCGCEVLACTGDDISSDKAQGVMKVLFFVLLSRTVQRLASRMLNVEGFDFLPILLRNSPTNFYACGSIIWKSDGGSYIFSNSLDEIKIKSLCAHLTTLVKMSLSSGKESQFVSKDMLYKVTEENRELLVRHFLLDEDQG